jgi:hypothetical protein
MMMAERNLSSISNSAFLPLSLFLSAPFILQSNENNNDNHRNNPLVLASMNNRLIAARWRDDERK